MGYRFERFPIEDGTGDEKLIRGNSSANFTEKDLSKELMEDSRPKVEFIDMLNGFIQEATSIEYYKKIDSLIGKEGALAELVEDIDHFIDRIGSQSIVKNCSSLDFIKNVSDNMMMWVKRIIKKGESDHAVSFIKGDFYALKEYLYLMENYKDFRSAELGSREGFTTRVKPEDSTITGDRTKYVNWAKSVLSDRKHLNH